MAHPQQRQFLESVRNKFPDFFKNKKILEIGSLNINGTVRDFFSDCEYIGIDVAPGKDVDIVCQGQEYDAPDESFDLVVSFECFEHNPEWIATFKNMHRMCKKDGLVLMSCASGARPEHGTTKCCPDDSPLTIQLGWDYYKNLNESDFLENFDIKSMFNNFEFSVGRFNGDNIHTDLYFYGIK